MSEVLDSVLNSRRLHLTLKVRQRGLKNIVVPVVDQDGTLGIHDLHRIHTLFSVHRYHDAKYLRPA